MGVPGGAEVEEVIGFAPGGVDGCDIQCLEGMQCMVERRKGGETGVAALHALRNDAVFDAMAKGSWAAGGWDPELFEACLCRSQTLKPAREGFNHILPRPEQIPAMLNEDAVAYRYEYADGTRATMLLLEGMIHDFTFAARRKGGKAPLSLQSHIDKKNPRNFFNPQLYAFEQMVLSGKEPFPIERTLLTTGLTAAGVESLWLGQKRIETPHLAIRYQPTEESTFWRS